MSSHHFLSTSLASTWADVTIIIIPTMASLVKPAWTNQRQISGRSGAVDRTPMNGWSAFPARGTSILYLCQRRRADLRIHALALRWLLKTANCPALSTAQSLFHSSMLVVLCLAGSCAIMASMTKTSRGCGTARGSDQGGGSALVAAFAITGRPPQGRAVLRTNITPRQPRPLPHFETAL